MKKFKMIPFVLCTLLIPCFAACVPMGKDKGGDGIFVPDEKLEQPEDPQIEIGEPAETIPDTDPAEIIGDADPGSADTVITLNNADTSFTGGNVKITQSGVYGTIVEITESGTYIVQGRLDGGFLSVSKKEKEVVVILNGAIIYSPKYSAIVCLKKSNVTIELAGGSENYLTDGSSYEMSYDEEEQPNAALLIRKDLTLRGSGKLTVNGNYNNGIGCRANLLIESGNITVTSADNSLKGNDSVTIKGGNLTLRSNSDGIKTESTDEVLGKISVSNATINLSAANDGLDSAAGITISDSVIKIITGGGSSAKAPSDSSASLKGLKSATLLEILSGELDINSNDDALHSNGDIKISGGVFRIASGDDAVHADIGITVSGGNISISSCYEGLEAVNVTISAGTIRIAASDDGVNISNGSDSSGTANPGRPGGGGFHGGGGGGETVISGYLTITGEYLYVNSAGDGLDSNGNIEMSGGTVICFGSASEPEVAVDFNGSFKMTGGTLLAVGRSQMAQQPTTATQNTVMFKINSALQSNVYIHLADASGKEVFTVLTQKTSSNIAFCSPSLANGSYTLYSGGTYAGGTATDNIYSGGTYSGGKILKTFTLSSIISTVTV